MLSKGTQLCRLFDPTKYNQTALTFRTYGPRSRFDHHRPVAGKPGDDPDRGIYYAARTLSSSIVEVFGDIGLIDCNELHVAVPKLTRPLKLLNLCNEGAMLAGSVAALAKVPDYAMSQRWSRYFYEAPDFEQCDGIVYYNAHNDEEALALYERAANALACPASSVVRLDHPALRFELLSIASRNNLICLP